MRAAARLDIAIIPSLMGLVAASVIGMVTTMPDQLAYEAEPQNAICPDCLEVLQNPTYTDGRFWFCRVHAWERKTEALAERIRRTRQDEDERLRLRCKRCLSNARDAIPELGELCERCAKDDQTPGIT